MVRATGQMGVPVIIVDGEVVIGFDRERLKSLVAAAGNGRPRFGLKIADASKFIRVEGRSDGSGAYVGGVAAGSLGEKAGLKVGDVITRINSDNIAGAAAAERALSGLRTGDVLSFVFKRGGDVRKSEIVI
jgi:S1-C subfamily serine protease